MDPEPTEYELALRARDGDRDALAELVERMRLGLFALAYAELRHLELTFNEAKRLNDNYIGTEH